MTAPDRSDAPARPPAADRGDGGPGTLRRLRRTTGDERRLAGVAGGVARALGVDPTVVRIAVVVLTVTSGLGLLLYVVGALVLPAADEVPPPSRPRSRRDGERALGAALVAAGTTLLARRLGLALPDAVLWPVVLVASGAAVAWSQADRSARPGAGPVDWGRAAVVRLVVGGVLLAAGIGTVAAADGGLAVAVRVGAAVLATTAGIVLLAGPWLLRLGRQLSEERAERARADERARVAAHLHDSVLQTLALIQRRADDPGETVALARRQERELRSWLYGGPARGEVDPGAPPTLAGALDGVADDVEASFPVAVEVVVVGGDVPVDDAVGELVAALAEGVRNAAAHAGVPEVSVYVEVGSDELVAFVRDRGRGFDPAAVPDDRRGLADSVRGRLARVGGRTGVRTAPGEGTELELVLPRSSEVSP